MRVRSIAISVCVAATMTAGLFARGGSRPADYVRILPARQSPDTAQLAVPVALPVALPVAEAAAAVETKIPDTENIAPAAAEPAAESVAESADTLAERPEVKSDTASVAQTGPESESGERPRMRRRTEPTEGADTAVVFMKADWVTRRQIDTARVTCFVGNFAAHHNGTIITADSAIRYSDSYVECFGSVLINKNTTYVYGDRADYDSEMEIANVYAPLVKMVDGDAVLYTYNFSFDTHDNIGTFYGGGMVINRENRLESDRGYYYADYHEVVCVDRVEMESETYEMKGDSVIYNVDTDNAYYFDRSNIWNDKGEYLYADRGEYRREGELYKVTSNGYILTEKQEVWSDSIDYYRTAEHAVLRRNIQIDDSEHMTLGFGDYGEYWGDVERALLTVRPSVVNYDTSQGDTLYMRSDSMFLYTVEVFSDGSERVKGMSASAAEIEADTTVVAAGLSGGEAMSGGGAGGDEDDTYDEGMEDGDGDGAGEDGEALQAGVMRQRAGAGDGQAVNGGRSSRMERGNMPEGGRRMRDRAADGAGDEDGPADDGPSDSPEDMHPAADSLMPAADSLTGGYMAADSLAADSLSRELTPAELKAAQREEAARLKAEKKAEAQKARKEKLDRIAAMRLKKLQEQKAKDEAAARARREKAYEQHVRMLARENAKRAKKGLPPLEDTVSYAEFVGVRDTLANAGPDGGAAAAAPADALAAVVADSLNAADSTVVAADSSATASEWRDSTYKRVQCYRDVRIYRSDFQALCDSLVAFTSDSTAHLYIRPVLWNGNNQITSEEMDIFTARQMITQADFVGKPMMIAELDTMNYNQVTGKTMTAWFDENGQIYRNDVNGNVETVYYIQDSGTGEITDAMYLKSGDATYYIVDKQVETITYRTDAEGQLSPLDMIPETQTTRLQGFEWRGAERPVREDVFDREIRPSQRERVESLARPRFPITRQIESLMKRLIERGEWLDRVDVLSPEDEEWRRETLEKPYR